MASDDREFKAHTSLQDPTIVYPSPDKRGGLNRSMQHHLIYVCSLKVVLYETR